MKRAPRLNKADQQAMSECLPIGKFSWQDAINSLKPFGVTPDQVRTVIQNTKDVKRLGMGKYFYLPNVIELSKRQEPDEPTRIKYLDSIPASVLVANLRGRGYEVKCTRIEDL